MYAGNIDLILRTMVSEKRSYLFVIPVTRSIQSIKDTPKTKSNS